MWTYVTLSDDILSYVIVRDHINLYIETKMVIENCGLLKVSFNDISFSFNYGFARDVKIMDQCKFHKIAILS